MYTLEASVMLFCSEKGTTLGEPLLLECKLMLSALTFVCYLEDDLINDEDGQTHFDLHISNFPYGTSHVSEVSLHWLLPTSTVVNSKPIFLDLWIL